MDMNFSPVTGEPFMPQPLKKKKPVGLILGITAAAVLVVMLTVVAGIKSGIFLSRPQKILQAMANTLQERSELMEDVDFGRIVAGGKYTVSLTGEVDGVGVDATYARGKSMQSFSGEMSTYGQELQLQATLDDEELRVCIPFIDEDTILVYNYTEKNSGELMAMLEEEGFDQESVNEMLKTLYSGGEENPLTEELAKAVLKSVSKWEFVDLDKEEFEINGREVSCKGYGVTIGKEEVADLADAVAEVLEEQAALLEDVESSADMIKALKNLDKELSGMEDLEIRFFIYKNMLASVQMEADGHKVELEFLGGECRTQNMVLKMDGIRFIELEGDTDGSQSASTLRVMGMKMAEWSYDAKDGSYECEVWNEEGVREFYLAGSIKRAKKELAIDVDELAVSGEDSGVKGRVTLKTGADIEELSGDELDVGKMGMRDFYNYFSYFMYY